MQGFGMWNSQGEGSPVSLTAVRFNTRVTALGQKTCVEQVFINRETQPIEAIYTFPLPDGAAVCGFEAITGERILTGIIEELAKGIEKYEAAVEEGHGAFMAELWRPDVFSTRIGNLKPNQAVLIRLTYLAEIDIAERKLRFSLPTTLAPRYGTSTGMDPVTAAVESDALNPPHVLSIPYGLELNIEIDLGLKLKSLGSPTTGLRIEPPADNSTCWKASLAAARVDMNQSVVIEAELARELSATALVETGPDAEQFLSVNFLPEFDPEQLDSVPPREVVFVLDCSGSMNGPSIDQAKTALALCLKSLNEGDRFNICRFGSSFHLMHPESVLYSQTTLDCALVFLNSTSANLGGTELFAPLSAILQDAHPEFLREIILLTDGQVTNEPALVQLAAGFRGKARIFSFGIGPASSEFLVKGIAAATGGASEFIAPEERIEAKVLRMFGRMASPRLDHIEVDWHHAQADAEPRRIAALFDGEPLRIAARLTGAAPAEVTLRALWNGQQKHWTVPVTASPFPRDEHNRGPIAQSWARRRLTTLELTGSESTLSDEARKTIVELSKRFHILSKETTLLAVEHRSIQDRTHGLPAQRRIPVMLAKNWGGDAVMCGGAVMLSKAAVAAAPAGAFAPPPAPASVAMPATGGMAKPSVLKRLRNALHDSMDSKSRKEISLDEEIRPQREAADPLHELLMAQSAEGWFKWSEPLNDDHPEKSATRQELLALIDKMPSELHGKLLATALAVLTFHKNFSAQRDLWQLAAKKALRWLAKSAPAVGDYINAKLAFLPVK